MNQAAKKVLVSAIIVGGFIIYSLIHGRAAATTPFALVPRYRDGDEHRYAFAHCVEWHDHPRRDKYGDRDPRHGL